MARATPAIMFQGTGSDVGKSLLVAGLCRLFTRRGLKVRPFKPQNMSNNAAVTVDGGEIGRAQALQARACGLDATCDMNPVLLKPQSDRGSQVVVQGRVRGSLAARDYAGAKAKLLPAVLASFARLSDGADLILIEGAGSPAEINLRQGDIANMGFAEAADVPVVLVGDIDRGGVIAALVGTAELLPAHERRRIEGVIINKFRGDPALFAAGLDIITRKTGFPSLGILPYFAAARRLPAEDSVALEGDRGSPQGGPVKIAVATLARIANFDDFDPLIAEPEVSLHFVPAGTPLPLDCHLIILPGSKATRSDLAYFRSQGWDRDLAAHLRRGGRVLGICAGYQMLGLEVADPDGIEGPPGAEPGLGLLSLRTLLAPRKHLLEVSGRALCGNAPVHGYEMHMGESEGHDRCRPLLILNDRPEGACSEDGRVMGCYLHGLFNSDAFRRAFLKTLHPGFTSELAFDGEVEATLDGLAGHIETHLDVDRILRIAESRDGVSP